MMDRIITLLLRIAVRRWPADVRDERAREWAAELEAVGREMPPGRATLTRFLYVASLAASPPLTDPHGAPRGWREVVPRLGGRFRWPATLLVLGFVATASAQVPPAIIAAVGRPEENLLNVASALGYLAAAVCWAVVGLRLGRRATPRAAVAGPLALSLALALPHLAVLTAMPGMAGPPVDLVGVGVCVLTWVLFATGLVYGLTRPATAPWRRMRAVLAVVGVPTAALWGVFAGLLVNGIDRVAGLSIMDTNTISTRLTGSMLYFAGSLLVLGGFAAGFAQGTTRPHAAEPVATPVPPMRASGLTRIALGTGLAALTTGILGWAYTIAVQTPDMRRVAAAAPMPGGDGELFMWVAELRWATILLAATGLLLATADRPAAPLAAVVLAALMLGGDAAAERLAVTGPDGLRGMLAGAAIAVVVAWWVAGRPAPERGDRRIARRLTVIAIVCAYTGPLVLGQGTATVNHPYLPVALAVVMAAVPAVFIAVAGVSVVAAGPADRSPLAAGVLLGGPAVLLAVLGAGSASGMPPEVTQPVGVLLAGPLLVTTVALLRPRRPDAGPARAVLARAGWTVAALAAAVPAAFVALAFSSLFGAHLLLALAGSTHPADGLSMTPGAALLAVIVAAALTRQLGRSWTPMGSMAPLDVQDSRS